MDTVDAVKQKEVTIQLRGRQWSDEALKAKVTDAPSYEKVIAFAQVGKQAERQVAEFFRPLKDDAHRMHKNLCTKENEILAPIQRGIRYLKDIAAAWKLEQDRLQAERDRKAKEAMRKLEEEQRLELAVQAEGLGIDPDAILNTPLTMPEVRTAPLVPKVAGASPVMRYRAEVIDKMALLKAIVEGRAPMELVEPNQSALNAQARSLKSGFSVAGCKLIEEPDFSLR
jgi:hypothetical protein